MEPRPVRHFIALPLPAPVIEALQRDQATLLGELGETARASSPAQLHVTVAFLGDRTPAEVDHARELLHTHLSGIGRADLELGQVERFGGGSVLARTLAGPSLPALAERQAALACDLVAAGLMRDERRAWRPHVSIVRARGRGRLRLPSVALPALALQVDRACLMSSTPRGGARVHAVVDEVSFH